MVQCKIGFVFCLLMQYLHAQRILYEVGEPESVCDCKSITDCASLKALLDRREFAVLKTHKSCGFERKVPKYCCPIEVELKTVTESSPPVSVSGRIKPQELITENPRHAYFNYLKRICGKANSNRIFGGDFVSDHEYPWLAALVYGSSVRCGGVLVSHNVIITAAHCIVDKLNKVKLGHADISKTKEFEIESVKIHHGYDPKSPFLYNDIALIKISQDLTFDNAIKPICLPEKEFLTNETLTVSGWGFTEALKLSDVLLQVDLDFVDQAECEAKYRSKGAANFELTRCQICAQGFPGEDSCNGDSGGPLMQAESQQHYLIGITSFGTKKCDSFVPGVYTNVFQYDQWIRDFVFNQS